MAGLAEEDDLLFGVVVENSPPSTNYWVNERGTKLHFRCFVPDNPRAIFFFFHGVGGHSSSANKIAMGKHLADKGLAAFFLEDEGHGYSDGERCHIGSADYLVDDCLKFIALVCGGCGTTDNAIKCNFEEGMSKKGAEAVKHLPFFLSGESMGGGLSIRCGLSLQEEGHMLKPRFKGAVLIAPAIVGNIPPAVVITLLKYGVVPFASKRMVPSFLESVNKPEAVWRTAQDRARVAADRWGKPGGIGWGHNMKFGMGLALVNLLGELQSRLGEVSFPFMLMQDPEDEVVLFKGAEMLIEKAATPTEDRHREVHRMEGGLHDLVSNENEAVLSKTVDWVEHHLNR